MCIRARLAAAAVQLLVEVEGHDLVVAFGTAIVRLPRVRRRRLPARGRRILAVTSGRMKRLGHRSGHFLIGDPADALKRLAASVPDAGRPPRPAQPPVPPADTAGPAFTAEAIMDAVNAAKTGH